MNDFQVCSICSFKLITKKELHVSILKKISISEFQVCSVCSCTCTLKTQFALITFETLFEGMEKNVFLLLNEGKRE